MESMKLLILQQNTNNNNKKAYFIVIIIWICATKMFVLMIFQLFLDTSINARYVFMVRSFHFSFFYLDFICCFKIISKCNKEDKERKKVDKNGK